MAWNTGEELHGETRGKWEHRQVPGSPRWTGASMSLHAHRGKEFPSGRWLHKECTQTTEQILESGFQSSSPAPVLPCHLISTSALESYSDSPSHGVLTEDLLCPLQDLPEWMGSNFTLAHLEPIQAPQEWWWYPPCCQMDSPSPVSKMLVRTAELCYASCASVPLTTHPVSQSALGCKGEARPPVTWQVCHLSCSLHEESYAYLPVEEVNLMHASCPWSTGQLCCCWCKVYSLFTFVTYSVPPLSSLALGHSETGKHYKWPPSPIMLS
jgi:hypothetical protein